MKTIIDWFEQLPEPVRYQAIKNTTVNQLNEYAVSLSDAIERAFIWRCTDQGHEFWENIYIEYEE